MSGPVTQQSEGAAMRTYQVTQREGERLGDIDWNYNFRPHFDGYCCNEQRKLEFMVAAIENLFQVERLFKKGIQLRVTEGQFAHDLLDVGMYDGWPYWKPVPSICIRTVLGGSSGDSSHA